MMNHGKVRAAEAPEAITIDDFSVWLAHDVQEVTVQDEQETHTEYEFDLIQYEKDEYIRLMVDQNASLEQQVTDTQLALCDVYEMIGG